MRYLKNIQFSIAVVFLSMLVTPLKAQKLDKEYILQYLEQRWDTVRYNRFNTYILVDTSYIDSVNSFMIDRKEYSVEEGWKRISNMDRNDVMMVYPLTRTDPYRPIFYRTIGIKTKSGQDKNERKKEYEYIAQMAFKTEYDYRRKDTTGIRTQNYALVINDTLVRNNKERPAFYRIPYEEIESISSIAGYRKPFYGKNSRNGVVFIWTRRKK